MKKKSKQKQLPLSTAHAPIYSTYLHAMRLLNEYYDYSLVTLPAFNAQAAYLLAAYERAYSELLIHYPLQ